MKIKLLKVIPISLALLISAMLALPAAGQYFLETELFSGKVTSVKNNVIVINNKSKFLPAPAISKAGVAVGTKVSLRYYVNDKQENVYFEVKEGVNSLKRIAPPANPPKKPNL